MENPQSSDIGSLIPTVIQYRRDLESLNVQLAKTTLTGKISSLSVAETLFLYMEETQARFSELQEKLVDNLIDASLSKVSKEITFKAQVTIDILIRNLFERTADVGFLATDDDIRRFLKNDGNVTKDFIEERLVEYVKKYSVYDDIIILDPNGKVMAKLDRSNKITQSNDPLILETIKSGEEYTETYRSSDLQKHKKNSLIYSAKITANNDRDSEVLGVLCLCFGFDVEMKEVFKKLANSLMNETIVLTDTKGNVIASSNRNMANDRDFLKGDEEKDYILKKFKNHRFILSSASTKGYQGYFGSGWHGMVLAPVSSAFKIDPENKIDIPDDILENTNLIPDKLKTIITHSEEINEDLIDVVINGEIIASKQRAYALNPILENIRSISGRIHSSINDSTLDIRNTIVSSLVGDVKSLSSLAVDIMDRNLYERANDCRWWALTSDFRRILDKDVISEEDSTKVTEILAYINELYTVYTNLFVYDKNQKVIAVSNPEYNTIIGKNVTGKHITSSLGNQDSQKYFVSEFDATHLYDDKPTYIYTSSITSLENSKTVGGIGIVFDSEPEFKEILKDTQPSNKDIKDTISLLVEPGGKIISSTDKNYPPGSTCSIGEKYLSIDSGDSIASLEVFNEKNYIVGASRSSGYREYKVSDNYENDIIALVLIEI